MSESSLIPTITKLEAANRQLCTAIRMFFDNDDPVAIHTLACAAREIYEKRCKASGVTRTFDFVQNTNPSYTEKQLWNILNSARNFFKHEGTSLEDEIEFSDDMNDFAIFSACNDCTTLCQPNQPIEVQAYSIWFLLVKERYEEGSDPDDIKMANQIANELDTLFPGVRQANREEQKRVGRRLLNDAENLVTNREISLPLTGTH